MQSNFPLALSWTGLSEGGFVNDPLDPGGATNHGITHISLAIWRGVKSVTAAQVKALTKAEADQIYKAMYWDKVRGDLLPSGLDYAVFDYGVNSGPRRAIKDLQRALNALFVANLKVDGWIGEKTLDAIGMLDTQLLVELISDYCHRRWAFMKSLKHWKRFKNGWTTRVMGKHKGVQTTDIGVIDRATRLAASSLPVDQIPAPVPPTRDMPIAKAEPEQPSIVDAIKNPSGWGPLGSIVSLFGSLAAGSGPVQWGFAALIIIFALVGALYAFKLIQNMDPA